MQKLTLGVLTSSLLVLLFAIPGCGKNDANPLAAFEPASGGGSPQPPAAASSPSPADGATDVSAARTLSWTADSGGYQNSDTR